MSRVGRNPIKIPEGVEVKLDGRTVVVKGEKGQLSRRVNREIEVKIGEGELVVRPRSSSRQARALWGLNRTLTANMVEGVTRGFVKELEMVGIGYRAQTDGKKLVLRAGFSHPVEVAADDVQFTVKDNTKITVSGADKQLVGQVAAKIRRVRPPEPYKGKGIRYKDEKIVRKPGKAAKAGVGLGGGK